MVTFFAGGVARPKGSSRAFTAKGGKAHVAPASSKEKGWRAGVSNAAAAAMAGALPFEGPVTLKLEFYAQRPKSHFTAKGVLKPKAPRVPCSAPDASKLTRSVEDALNGIVFRDDALVVALLVYKRYTSETRPHVGVDVCVWPWPTEVAA